jgi:fructoselysine 6-kinase
VNLCGLGDNVVDYYRERGLVFPGGNPLNVAVFARRAGLPTAYLGVVGDDDAGRLIRTTLEAEQIEISRLRTAHGPNAMSVIGLDEHGNRSFCPGGIEAPAPLVLDDADFDYLAGFRVVHIGEWGYLEDQVPQVAERSKVSFDFGAKPLSYVEPLAQWVTIAELSLPEADTETAVACARRIRHLGPRTVLVTRGSAGATLLSEDGTITHVGTRPVAVIDTNGAGDAFIGTLLARLLKGDPPRPALDAAARVAADTCKRIGVLGKGLPRQAEVGA